MSNQKYPLAPFPINISILSKLLTLTSHENHPLLLQAIRNYHPDENFKALFDIEDIDDLWDNADQKISMIDFFQTLQKKSDKFDSIFKNSQILPVKYGSKDDFEETLIRDFTYNAKVRPLFRARWVSYCLKDKICIRERKKIISSRGEKEKNGGKGVGESGSISGDEIYFYESGIWVKKNNPWIHIQEELFIHFQYMILRYPSGKSKFDSLFENSFSKDDITFEALKEILPRIEFNKCEGIPYKDSYVYLLDGEKRKISPIDGFTYKFPFSYEKGYDKGVEFYLKKLFEKGEDVDIVSRSDNYDERYGWFCEQIILSLCGLGAQYYFDEDHVINQFMEYFFDSFDSFDFETKINHYPEKEKYKIFCNNIPFSFTNDQKSIVLGHLIQSANNWNDLPDYVEEYEEEIMNDPYLFWVDTLIEEKKSRLTSTNLFNNYVIWCRRKEVTSLSVYHFRKKLKESRDDGQITFVKSGSTFKYCIKMS